MPETRDRDRGLGLLGSLDILASRVWVNSMSKPRTLRIHGAQVPAGASELR